MRMLIVGCLFVAMLVVLPATAQEVSDTQFFPVVARLAGVAPSQWVTDLVVCNINDYSIEIGLEFFEEEVSHGIGDLDFSVRRTLGPLETQLYEDVLSTLFGIEEDTKGALIVTCANDFGLPNPDDADIIATSRTYDVSSPLGGTAGQTVPSNGNMANFTGTQSVGTGARNDGSFRSNLGFVNSSLEDVTIHYRIWRSDGTVAAEGDIDMGPLSMVQRSFNSLGVGSVSGPLTVEAWLDPSDVSPDPCMDFANSFFVYFSKADRVSQDAEFSYLAPGEIPECVDD